MDLVCMSNTSGKSTRLLALQDVLMQRRAELARINKLVETTISSCRQNQALQVLIDLSVKELPASCLCNYALIEKRHIKLFVLPDSTFIRFS